MLIKQNMRFPLLPKADTVLLRIVSPLCINLMIRHGAPLHIIISQFFDTQRCNTLHISTMQHPSYLNDDTRTYNPVSVFTENTMFLSARGLQKTRAR